MSSETRRSTGPHPLLPQVFGRYLLIQRISRGGMGEIFLAKHGLRGFEKVCVIKKVLPHLAEDEHFISRFIDEAQVAIKLSHANIAQVFEVGRVEDEYFLALEYVEGRDVRRTLATLSENQERLPADLALFVAREVTNGLSYTHRRVDGEGESLNLVHCDISPPNVMLSFEGEIKLIDFGIAKSVLRGTATDPKRGFGKFGYMAPEQLIRGGTVDHRTDIYAAGVVLYELLTGKRLYEMGESPDYRTLARMVARGQHPLPSEFDVALRPYDALVAKALHPKPEERFQSSAKFRDAIQSALVKLSPTISADRLGQFMRNLFGSELAEQRTLAAQAQAADLSEFEAQLTTQSATTVSYALAHMPLLAPQTEMVDRLPHPGILSLGPLPSARRKYGLIAFAALGVLLIGGTVLALVSSGSAGDGQSQRIAAAADDRAGDESSLPSLAGPSMSDRNVEHSDTLTMPEDIVDDPVEPASPDLAADARTKADQAKADQAKKDQAKKDQAKKDQAKKDRARKDKADKDKPDKEPKQDAKAVDAVLAKFQSVASSYRTFKKSYGSRLETEWADLATFAQYARNRPEKMKILDQRIDKFRARMRQAMK